MTLDLTAHSDVHVLFPATTEEELKTKEAFRRYFSGMPADRMGRLLSRAYAGLEPADLEKKVMKRLRLLNDVLMG